jgi:hypothetical protein
MSRRPLVATRSSLCSTPQGRAGFHVALAYAYAKQGNHQGALESIEDARNQLAGAERRDRQLVEILSSALGDRLARSLDLAFEHVAEFGSDPLLIGLLCLRVKEERDPHFDRLLGALIGLAQAPRAPGEPDPPSPSAAK